MGAYPGKETSCGAGVPPFLPFFPCPFTSSFFAVFRFFLFPFLVCFTYFLLLSIPSLSTRIVTTLFPGRRRRSNLGLVCSVHFVLFVLLS